MALKRKYAGQRRGRGEKMFKLDIEALKWLCCEFSNEELEAYEKELKAQIKARVA